MTQEQGAVVAGPQFVDTGKRHVLTPPIVILRASPDPIVAFMAAGGWLLAVLGEYLPSPGIAAWYALLIITLAAVAMFLLRWKPEAARWFLVLSLVVAVLAAYAWLQSASAVMLLAIPVAIAAALLSPRHGFLTAIAETALMLLLVFLLPAHLRVIDVVLALFALWAIACIAYAIWLPAYRFEEWLTHYFRQAQDTLEEARSQRAEMRQALDDLAQANRQLALAHERMAALRTLAEEAQRSKAAFVAKVSHEFRTPLNMIIGLTSLLTSTPQVYGKALPAELLEDLAIVRRNCDHLASLINDVLDLSQAEAGRLVLHRERVNLAEIVEEALEVVRVLLEQKGLSMRVDMPDDLAPVYCDRTRIRQVLLNLLSNAARFTEQGGIVIRAVQEGGSVVMSVVDTGPGIPPEEAKRIFEPFGQATSGIWRERGGSGLGLSISKQFIEMHEGRMWLESQLGVGSTFYFTLPVSPLLPPAAGPARWFSEEYTWRGRTTPSSLPAISAKPRVVVCDRSGELCTALVHCSDEVEFVDTRDLAEAIGEIERCPAHVLLVNSASPHDLWPLAETARRKVPDTPVLACCVPAQLARAHEAGAAACLIKPVTQSALQQAIQTLGNPVKSVLIVEDDADMRQLLARMLSADLHIEVTTASNGVQAIEELRAHRPDLMLLDIVMPDMDGWEVLRHKSADPLTSDVPVLLVTAQDPAGQPMSSKALLATFGEGLSLSKVLKGSLVLSSLLLRPE